ncbi:MAG: hypothetical protein ACXAC8_17595 [Candidatus Hodarchaeales archaeon]|jgi:hypothetical protein
MPYYCKICYNEIEEFKTLEIELWIGNECESERIIDSNDSFCSPKCIAKYLQQIASQLEMNPNLVINNYLLVK